MLPTRVNPDKISEVVYLPKVAAKPKDGIHISGWVLPLIAGVMIALAAWWFNTHLPLVITDAIEKRNSPIETRLTKVETFLKLTSKDAASVIGQIPRVLNQSSDPKQIEAALSIVTDAATEAQNNREQIGSGVDSLSQAGDAAIDALPRVSKQQLALDAVGALASYRTSQNGLVGPSETEAKPVTSASWDFAFFLAGPSWETHAQVNVLGVVPSAAAARWEPLNGDMNHGRITGPEWIFVNGIERSFTVALDENRLKNVVARNITIRYNGGNTSLSNVIFVDCTLIFTKSDSSLALARAVFADSTLTFNRM
jgi:hypothetical protein